LLVAKSASGNNKEILTNLRKVYSHEKTLVQCSNFFKQHPWIEAVPYTNTADAAKLISGSHDPSLGALADIDNAELYKLRVIRPDVENNKYNYTRFIVISKNASADPTDDKCSLMLRLPHLSGSLSTILTLLTKQDCNLTKIESRLLESAPLEYTFYLDFTFEGGPEKLKTTLEKLKDNVVTLHVFGSYRDERTTALTR
jgi:chorismate mutase/prephenate dehydratase